MRALLDGDATRIFFDFSRDCSMIRAFGPSMTTVRVIVKIIAFGKVKAVWVCEKTIHEVCAGVVSKQH